MKYELFGEYLSHYLVTIVILAFCGGFLTNFVLIAGGGAFAVFVLNAPVGPLGLELAVPLYGLVAFLLLHGATRFWFFKEALAEWENLSELHRNALAQLRHFSGQHVKN